MTRRFALAALGVALLAGSVAGAVVAFGCDRILDAREALE